MLFAGRFVFAQSSNSPSAPAYSSFKIITDRNIFSPRRYVRNGRAERPITLVDSFTLVGTMRYEKGDLAFFEGSRPDLRKVAKVADSIAGYKITDIGYNSVKMTSETNLLQKELQLGVGMQMRREDSGPWHVASNSEVPALASSSAMRTSSPVPAANSAASSAEPQPTATASDSNATAAGSDDPVLRRLMQRREQENNR
jgi:hypothetical protein